MHCLFRCLVWTLLMIAHIVLFPTEASAGEMVVGADNWAAWEQRRSSEQKPPQTLIVEGIVLDSYQASRAMILERVEPFGNDSRLRINGQWAGEISNVRHYYRGRLEDEPGSIGTLSIGSDGDFRGLLSNAEGYWIFTNADAEAERRESMHLIALPQVDAPKTRGIDDDQVEGFQCRIDSAIRNTSASARDFGVTQASRQQVWAEGQTQRYRVRIAFESDYSFFQIFEGQPNPAQAAQDYLGDLVNYISGLYVNDLNTELEISSISLWNSPDQPWQNLGDAGCLLSEMGLYWNDPNNAVDDDRTLAHFVTGSSTDQSGVAWLGALCATPGNSDTGNQCAGFSGVQNALGDYGVSGGLTGDFDVNIQPRVWDYVVVAHELGHNFNSDHTHCYNTVNVPGFASTVIDECHNGEQGFGCWAGAESLPGLPGDSSGTIMSYCHLLDPGLANIAPSFGLDHPFGDTPERVPVVMRAHVLAAAATNAPRCPQPVTTGPSFLVSTQAQGPGAISPTSANVVEDETVSFNLTPEQGGSVQSASGCNGNLQGNTYTTGPITAPCTVDVVFAAAPELCAVVNQTIPDNSPQGISSTLPVMDIGAIDQLAVTLDIEHSWVGDIIVDLEHEPTGTTVRLVDRPGVTAENTFGCSGSDINVTLTDEAGPGIQDSCVAQVSEPAYPEPAYRPANALSEYAGQSITGDWTLSVSDNAVGDTGQLQRWCLVPTVTANQDLIYADGFEQ